MEDYSWIFVVGMVIVAFLIGGYVRGYVIKQDISVGNCFVQDKELYCK